jgi:hypothetical protein
MKCLVNVPVDISLGVREKESEYDVIFTDPDTREFRLPAFFDGQGELKVRFAANTAGTYSYRVVRTDGKESNIASAAGGTLTAEPYTGENPLFRRGRLKVAESNRYLTHADGTPFFWLADTWWMGLTARLHFPAEFDELLANRVEKGFSVVQIVAGLYPDMPAFDDRGANEKGFPWTTDFGKLEPAYFDAADRRIRRLVEAGIVPCIVGCWGYFVRWMGVEKMKQHWRNLVARYAAMPVVFCMAGETSMPYYLSDTREKDAAAQKKDWTEVTRYVRKLDPYRNPITTHPTRRGWEQIEEPSLMDFEMLQTGHGDRGSLPFTRQAVKESYERGTMPVLDSEVCYEGIGEASRQDVQRYAFWICMLSGACGHTYGANGIWQVNSERRRYGPSPHGMEWGDTTWQDAYKLPGSGQLGMSKRFLQRFDWFLLEPRPAGIEPAAIDNDPMGPYAAVIPGRLCVVYSPVFLWSEVRITCLESNAEYTVRLFDPVRGETHERGSIRADTDGSWTIPQTDRDGRRKSFFPLFQDWVLLLEKK